ncbi:MAG: endonuclease MutS2 [Spirochaetes bacterium]|nr:endonuclease MutS2 [Spirochaetota bacterium]
MQIDDTSRETGKVAEKTLGLLEYAFVMERVASCALSDEAAEIIRGERPLGDAGKVSALKSTVFNILARMSASDNMPRNWLPSVGSLLPKLRVEGAVLELDEVFAIGLFIERAEELVKWLTSEGDTGEPADTGGKYPFLSHLPVCLPVAVEIFKVIDREGKMRDLPPLRAIKRRIKSLGRELEAAVARYTSDEETRRMLQSPMPSLRDGRTVLAVKANFRGRIRGIVHEVSSSGQTIFVEPLEAVEKNNEIIVEKRNLDAEIRKIMRELTARIGEYNTAHNLEKYHLTIIELEVLRSKAFYSLNTKGHFANSGDVKNIVIKQARHPMIKNAVPIDVSMNDGTRVLIITGPNTGGKTVTLKTLGLFAAMNQSGIALPAAEGSFLPVFDCVYADIGDSQSIEQSLSTFSAHISNIASIINMATEKSLVLLDELGSGTDPQEGGAIAMAVLDHLIEKRPQVIITTHHGILKNYGYTRQGVENASVEFDSQTLSPTYKVLSGIPGESHALDIAAKNGLAKIIVEKARNYLVEEKADVSQLIKGLREKHLLAEALESKIKTEDASLRELRRKADLRELRLRQKEAELKREGAGKLEQLLYESRKTLENLVREVKEGNLDREKTRAVKEFLNDLARNADEEKAALEEEEALIEGALLAEQENSEEGAPANFSGFAPGMEVFVGAAKQRGRILRHDKKGSGGDFWLVETGSLKISLSEKKLKPASPAARQAAAASWDCEFESSSNLAVLELKLLGLRLDEATEALRRQIEAAAMNGLKTFAVVHGKGNGILQKGVHDYLKNDAAVADYYFSRPELGGTGRTEVVLR